MLSNTYTRTGVGYELEALSCTGRVTKTRLVHVPILRHMIVPLSRLGLMMFLILSGMWKIAFKPEPEVCMIILV